MCRAALDFFKRQTAANAAMRSPKLQPNVSILSAPGRRSAAVVKSTSFV